jgi:hypothetical protein
VAGEDLAVASSAPDGRSTSRSCVEALGPVIRFRTGDVAGMPTVGLGLPAAAAVGPGSRADRG